VLFEVYHRSGTWKVRAVRQGYDDGLAGPQLRRLDHVITGTGRHDPGTYVKASRIVRRSAWT
jgi:hypothetical protein